MRDAVVQHLEETERSADTGAEMAVGFGCWLLAVQTPLQGEAKRSLRDNGC